MVDFLKFFFSFFFLTLMLCSDSFLAVPPHCSDSPSLGALTSGKRNWCEYQMCVPVR